MNIAIFASGAGTNAARIIEHFNNHPRIRIALIVSNKSGAGVITVAKNAGIATLIIHKERFFRGDGYVEELAIAGIDFLVLAGFLWKVPLSLLQAFAGRIINIHPALLPAYGGKGMYGQYVHTAVIENREVESGITIHYVDEVYDHGDIIFQARCAVLPGDTSDSLARRVHQLEHQHYARVIEGVLQGR